MDFTAILPVVTSAAGVALGTVATLVVARRFQDRTTAARDEILNVSKGYFEETIEAHDDKFLLRLIDRLNGTYARSEVIQPKLEGFEHRIGLLESRRR